MKSVALLLLPLLLSSLATEAVDASWMPGFVTRAVRGMTGELPTPELNPPFEDADADAVAVLTALPSLVVTTHTQCDEEFEAMLYALSVDNDVLITDPVMLRVSILKVVCQKTVYASHSEPARSRWLQCHERLSAAAFNSNAVDICPDLTETDVHISESDIHHRISNMNDLLQRRQLELANRKNSKNFKKLENSVDNIGSKVDHLTVVSSNLESKVDIIDHSVNKLERKVDHLTDVSSNMAIAVDTIDHSVNKVERKVDHLTDVSSDMAIAVDIIGQYVVTLVNHVAKIDGSFQSLLKLPTNMKGVVIVAITSAVFRVATNLFSPPSLYYAALVWSIAYGLAFMDYVSSEPLSTHTCLCVNIALVIGILFWYPIQGAAVYAVEGVRMLICLMVSVSWSLCERAWQLCIGRRLRRTASEESGTGYGAVTPFGQEDEEIVSQLSGMAERLVRA